MIGMKSLKESVFYQVIYYLQNMHIKNKDGDYLHTIITGKPGTGKCMAYDFPLEMKKIYQMLSLRKSPS